MTFPQEILPELISYLKMLDRKGIKAIYMGESPSETEAEPEECEMKYSAIEASSDSMRGNLALLEKRVQGCDHCPLHKTRRRTVFGTGSLRSRVMFVGEAPGREEDLKGEPFVGRAGQLLDKIFQAIDLKREDVFITNILKCRPPENRDPVESEVRSCEEYLIAQIETIKPKLICALGRIAAQWLLRTKAPLSALRLGEHSYQNIPVLVTYHPAALLRQPQLKRSAWEDFKTLKSMLESS
jgi:uracil-DNA glycosylase family 4